jgi:hypothetical protein
MHSKQDFVAVYLLIVVHPTEGTAVVLSQTPPLRTPWTRARGARAMRGFLVPHHRSHADGVATTLKPPSQCWVES